MDVLVVMCTFPDAATARRVARELVDRRLAACVSLIPAVESVYRWQGAVESANEVLAVCKTTAEAYPALEGGLRSLHPYEVPEILALPVAAGLADYLSWVGANAGDVTRGTGSSRLA